jgi:hypothetical protein
VAIGITQGMGVNAYVLESMTFCVSGAKDPDSTTTYIAPTAGCTGVHSPSLKLGETVGTTVALDASAISTGTDYAQLSTNAASGAIVSLKSNRAGCGGLVRAGATNCDIKPTTTASGITAGNAFFGLTVGSTSSTTDGVASGTIQPSGSYGSAYYLDYDTDNSDATGVTSSYGSQVLDTDGAPVSNKYVPVTFGASVNNTTPAGSYSAQLSMIATGTY